MELLTVDTVCDYVTRQSMAVAVARVQMFDHQDWQSVDQKDLRSSGNLNYAFAVRDAKGHAVFVKQAPDFIKVIGPAAQLTRERMRLEVQVYQEWVDKGEKAENNVGFHVRFDEEAMAFIMEFLGSSQLLQQSLFQGEAQETLAKSLGECMAIMHSRTHCSKLDAGGRARLAASYENRLLRDIQLEYVFSKCYREDPRAAMLREDSGFMTEVENLKAIYNGQNQENLSLCHGDLHAGSVMATRS
ncbi:Methylthioribose kinase (MTR kinase) [Durusdinium trenchii]|uniref:Methylthioribose kinase (MTR kinase) n=1 Tax=Durusdinium trenchii TaxID=1381693 RepID=A0ABP0J8W7_9DINO